MRFTIEDAEDYTNYLKGRLFAKIKPSGQCWIWQGQTDGGYGKIGIGSSRSGRTQLVHRVMYYIFCGDIPEGLELHHKCRRALCCRPKHLEPVTHAVNMALSKHALKTHCLNGHPFDKENTYIRKSGQRACRTCKKERRIALRLAYSVLR